MLWKSVVGDDDEVENDAGGKRERKEEKGRRRKGEGEVELDDRLDPVETIRYFSMAGAPMSFFDTSRFAHSRRLLRNKVSRHLRRIVSLDIARAIERS